MSKCCSKLETLYNSLQILLKRVELTEEGTVEFLTGYTLYYLKMQGY